MSEDPYQSPETISPVNPLPPVVVALFVMIIGIEATLSLAARGIIGGPGGIGWRLETIQTYAFSGVIYDWMWSNGIWPREHVIRFVSYLFIHTSFTHALIVCVMLLAMGKMVGEVFSGLATLVVFVGSGIIGALAYAVLLDDQVPLVGGFPGVYGLIGAFTYLLWLKLGELGAQQMRAFSLIGFLMGIQLVFGLFGSQNDWVADGIGFIAGFTMSFVLSPGGFMRLRDKLRRD